MPELPEVETMVRGLRPALQGQEVGRLEVLDGHLLEGDLTPESLGATFSGASVDRLERRGKWVVVLSDRGVLVIQPRMTGGFWLVSPEQSQHVRLIFSVASNKRQVWFTDARRLARIALYADMDAAEAAFARSHGPDALTIPLAVLMERLRKTSRSIKPSLMDQKVLAGIGNIYADEILHRARIHPERVASALTDAEGERLAAAIPEVLAEAIAAEGSSFDAGYKTVLGLEGGFLAENAVYGRAGKPCRVCGEAIVRAKIVGLTGRSTYSCPTCQPPPA